MKGALSQPALPPLVAAVLLALPGAAFADRSGGARAQEMKVALSPLAMVGAENADRRLRELERYVAGGLQQVEGVTLLSRRATMRAVRAAKRPELIVCEGVAACLAELGKLLKATYTVYGEVGGLGSAQVIYLKLVDVGSGEVVRSTTLELHGSVDPRSAAREASIKLLLPGRHTGRLRIGVDVKGASIFLNGELVGRSPAGAIEVPVGTHALRVTHPEFRDFVRFIDVKFDEEVRVEAPMQQFPIVASDMRKAGSPVTGAPVDAGVKPVPWYKRWYTIAGAGAAVFVTSAIVAGVLADGIEADRTKTVR